MPRTARPLALLAALGLSLTGLVAVAPAAMAVGAPVVVDDFNGTHIGTRTVTQTSSPPNSDPVTATFSESGGSAHITLTGPGNAAGEVDVSYALPAAGFDLTGGDAVNGNQQFFTEFASILRNKYNGSTDVLGLTLSVTVTDKNGSSGTINTGIGNTYAFSPALPFNCGPSVNTCFSKNGPIDFTHITNVKYSFFYPRNHDPGGQLDIVLDRIRATPLGGAPPTDPNPGVTATSPQPVCPGQAAHFTVAFTHVDTIDGFGPAPVTNQPPSTTGLRGQDVVVDKGTGALPTGTLTTSVSGYPSTYDVAVSGMTSDGDLHVSVPSGVVQDAWGSYNQASTSEPTVHVTVATAPGITAPAAGALTAGLVGTPYSQLVTVTGTPAPTVSISAGSLPPGLSIDSSTGTISGTPTTGGAYSFTVKAHNVCSPDATRAYTLVINQPPTLATSNPPAARVGGPYAGFTFTTTAGYPASTFSVTDGSLPSGMTLSSAGLLSGTPDVGTAGPYTFTVTATNGIAPDDSHQFALNVDLPPHITSAAPAGAATVGTAYTHSYTASGFPAPTWSVITGNLPPGLTLDASSGALTGTPTTAGSYSFTTEATNVEDVDTQDATIVVTASPVLDTTDPAHATVGTAYSQKLGVTGGDPAPSFTLTGGALPSGLSLASDGTISGTPDAGTAGSYAFTVQADNGVPPAASHQYTLDVWEPAAITSGDPADGVLDVAYPGHTFTASGFPAATFTVSAGALPPGLTLDDGGALTGTPTAVGSYTFTVKAASAAGDATHAYTIHVTDPPVITSDGPPHGVVGAPFTFTFTATGTPAPTFALTGSVPPGLSLDPTTGALTGTPTAAGTYAVTLTASNGTLPDDVQPYSVVIDQVPHITSAAPPHAVVGRAYTHTFTATGSPAPTFAVTAGTLPAGLALTPSGVLSGTPTAVGPTSFTVSATNGVGAPAAQPVTFVVDRIPSSTTVTLGRSVIVTGTLLRLTGHVTPADATGTVTFLLDGATAGTADVSGGVASLVVPVGAPGAHSVATSYAGDPTHAGSASAATSFTVLSRTQQQPGRTGLITVFLHYTGATSHVGGKVVLVGPDGVRRLALIPAGRSARFRNLLPGAYTIVGTALHGHATTTATLAVGRGRSLGVAIPRNPRAV